MSNIIFHRGNTEDINSTEVRDGVILFDTDKGRIYLDDNGKRLLCCKTIRIVNNIYNVTDIDTLSASKAKEIFFKKTDCVNSARKSVLVTSNNILLGCKAFASVFGLEDFSTIGSTVSEAIVNLTKYVEGTLKANNDVIYFTNSDFNENTNFRFFSSIYDSPIINIYTNFKDGHHTITIYYEKASIDRTVRVYYSNNGE